MKKKINALTALSDDQVADGTRLLAIADPTSGVAYQGTMAQVKAAVSPKKYKYTATGSEGTTLTIEALLNKTILIIIREGDVLFEADPELTPDSVEFAWNSTDITLGLSTNIGERYLIIYI